jgi:uncharacterized membrane protein
MGVLDISVAIVCFLAWVALAWCTDRKHAFLPPSLSQIMNIHRACWLENSLRRDLKMIDTSILAGLQHGAGFFASTALFAIGGCFALMGAAEQVLDVLADIPFRISVDRTAFELKVAGLIAIYAYSFFKFGWSYRLFNYCQILVGCIPMVDHVAENQEKSNHTVGRAVQINILAGKHFNAGLRGIFFSLGYIGWFLGPVIFFCATLLVVLVLIRRQYFSSARAAVLNGLEPS